MPGSMVSHYRIHEKLGESGMGVVYKAQDTKLDRLVALKFLPAHLAASEPNKDRLIQEAKAASVVAIQPQPTFQAGKPKLLFDEHRTLFTTVGVSFDVSLDGKRLLLTGLGTGDQVRRVNVILRWSDEVRQHFGSNR